MEMFAEIDADGSGALDEEELRKAQGVDKAQETWAPPGAKALGMSAEVMIRACRHRPSVRVLLETFLHANTALMASDDHW